MKTRIYATPAVKGLIQSQSMQTENMLSHAVQKSL